MRSVDVYHVPEKTYDALSKQASKNHRSVGDEVREILVQTFGCEEKPKPSNARFDYSRLTPWTDEEAEIINSVRDENRGGRPSIEPTKPE